METTSNRVRVGLVAFSDAKDLGEIRTGSHPSRTHNAGNVG